MRARINAGVVHSGTGPTTRPATRYPGKGSKGHGIETATPGVGVADTGYSWSLAASRSGADELGDNYFVSYAAPTLIPRHASFYAVLGVLGLTAIGLAVWTFRRFKPHSAETIINFCILAALGTIIAAMLIPRDREHREAVVKVMPFEATIYQKGRLPLMAEFRAFLKNEAWWKKHVARLLARYVDDGRDDEPSLQETLAMRDLQQVTQRVNNLVRRIIRASSAPARQRKALRTEAKEYLNYLAADGLIFSWMEGLPASFAEAQLDPGDAPRPRVFPIEANREYRLWLRKMLGIHLFKRNLWRGVPAAYPEFSTRCIICQDREVEVAFIGCGHAVVCADCGRTCLYGSQTSAGRCPLCRTTIEMLTDDRLLSSKGE